MDIIYEIKMTFIESIKTCLRKYANFSGRASRSEFWWWILFVNILFFALQIIAGLINNPDTITIAPLLLGIPTIAIMVRRLHDFNSAGIWIFPIILAQVVFSIHWIPAIIFATFMLLFFCKKGTVGANRFGEDPLEEKKSAINL